MRTEEIGQFDFISGHISPAIHNIVSRPCRYITLLRDPLGRIVSHYYARTPSPQQRSRDFQSLQDFMEIDNFMIRRILDTNVNTFHFLTLQRPEIHGKTFVKSLPNHYIGPITDEMIEEAKLKLREQFFLVGLTERFNDFVLLLSRKLGWKCPVIVTHNKTINKPQTASLDPKLVAYFKEKNKADYEIYAYAKQLFEAKWTELSMLDKISGRCHQSILKFYQRNTELFHFSRLEVSSKYS